MQLGKRGEREAAQKKKDTHSNAFLLCFFFSTDGWASKKMSSRSRVFFDCLYTYPHIFAENNTSKTNVSCAPVSKIAQPSKSALSICVLPNKNFTFELGARRGGGRFETRVHTAIVGAPSLCALAQSARTSDAQRNAGIHPCCFSLARSPYEKRHRV